MKKLYAENPNHIYNHFGDIDVGGFLIHQHLCHATGIGFQLYNMGAKELGNMRYRHCLQKLSTRDLERIQGVIEHPMYQDVVAAMIKDEVKLEQEILCCDIMEYTATKKEMGSN